jgi:hypothetical protein
MWTSTAGESDHRVGIIESGSSSLDHRVWIIESGSSRPGSEGLVNVNRDVDGCG